MISADVIVWPVAECDQRFGRRPRHILDGSAAPTAQDGIRSRLGSHAERSNHLDE